MAVFGELLNLYNDSGAIVFVVVLIFLMTFEGILHVVEVECTKRGFKALIKKLYREFMIMGFISFGILMATETSDIATDGKWYIAFHFAHIVIMFVGITFLVQAATLVSLISSRNRALLNYDACTNESLLIEYLHMHEQAPLSMKLFNYGPISIPIPRLREKIEFKILQYFFIRSYRLPFEFKYANYMCMVLRNYVIALVEVRPISWFIVAVFIALNYTRIRVIDPIFQAQVCNQYATDSNVDHSLLVSSLQTDTSSSSSLLQRFGRRLSATLSPTYESNVCPEYTLRVSFVLCCMTTLYLLAVLFASEVYIQKLIDRVLDVEEIFAYYDEAAGGLDVPMMPGVDIHQQRSSLMKMNSVQQQQILQQVRKRASSSAGVEEGSSYPPPPPLLSSHQTSPGTATPRARNVSNMIGSHRNDSITQSSLQYPSSSNAAATTTTPQKQLSLQNLTSLETGEIGLVLKGNIEDDIASPEPTRKEFKPLLLSQYSRRNSSSAALGRNSFKVLEERKSLAEGDIKNLREILQKSHSKRLDDNSNDNLEQDMQPLASMPLAMNRSRGNSLISSAGSGKFGPVLRGSFLAHNTAAAAAAQQSAPSMIMPPQDTSAPLPDFSILRKEFSVDARSSFAMADLFPNTNNANANQALHNNKIRIFGKSRRYLYLKCLDRIMQEEYFEHARAAKRASVSLDTSIAANVIANTSTNALNNAWMSSSTRDRTNTTLAIDPQSAMMMSHQPHPPSPSLAKEESPSSTPPPGITTSGTTLQRLFRTESPTPPLNSSDSFHASNNNENNNTMNLASNSGSINYSAAPLASSSNRPQSTMFSYQQLNNQDIKELRQKLKQTRHSSNAGNNNNNSSAPSPQPNATTASNMAPLMRGNSIQSAHSAQSGQTSDSRGSTLGGGILNFFKQASQSSSSNAQQPSSQPQNGVEMTNMGGRSRMRRYSISEASSPEAIMPEYLRGIKRNGSTVDQNESHGASNGHMEAHGNGGNNSTAHIPGAESTRLQTMHKHASTITTRTVRGMTNYFESLPDGEILETKSNDSTNNNNNNSNKPGQGRWWSWPLYHLIKYCIFTYGIPFFSSMQHVLLGHHLGVVVTNAIQDKDIAELQNDLKKIFVLQRPSLYYFVIEIGLLIQCLYVALWSTNLVVIINNSHYVILWHIAFLVPMIFNILVLKQVIFTSCILKSIVNIDQFVANRICEEAFNERLVIQRMRKVIREKLCEITLDRKYWKYILFDKFLQYSTDPTDEINDFQLLEETRLAIARGEIETNTFFEELLAEQYRLGTMLTERKILSYKDRHGTLFTLPSYINMKMLQSNNNTMNVNQWELFLRSLKLFLTPASIKQHFDVLDSDKDAQLTWSMISKIIFPELQKKQIKLGKKGLMSSHKVHDHHHEDDNNGNGNDEHKDGNNGSKHYHSSTKHSNGHHHSSNKDGSHHHHNGSKHSLHTHSEDNNNGHQHHGKYSNKDPDDDNSEEEDEENEVEDNSQSQSHRGEKQDLAFEYELTPSMMEALKEYREKHGHHIAPLKRGSLLHQMTKKQTGMLSLRKSIFASNGAPGLPPLGNHHSNTHGSATASAGHGHHNSSHPHRSTDSDGTEEDGKKQGEDEGESEHSHHNSGSGSGHHSSRRGSHHHQNEHHSHRHNSDKNKPHHHDDTAAHKVEGEADNNKEEEGEEDQGIAMTRLPFQSIATKKNKSTTSSVSSSSPTSLSPPTLTEDMLLPVAPLAATSITTSPTPNNEQQYLPPHPPLTSSNRSERTTASWNTFYSTTTNNSSGKSVGMSLTLSDKTNASMISASVNDSNISSNSSNSSNANSPLSLSPTNITPPPHTHRRRSQHNMMRRKEHHTGEAQNNNEDDEEEGEEELDEEDEEDYDSDNTLYDEEEALGVRDDDEEDENAEEDNDDTVVVQQNNAAYPPRPYSMSLTTSSTTNHSSNRISLSTSSSTFLQYSQSQSQSEHSRSYGGNSSSARPNTAGGYLIPSSTTSTTNLSDLNNTITSNTTTINSTDELLPTTTSDNTATSSDDNRYSFQFAEGQTFLDV